ncbi:hypothetical protein [Jeotgalibacillus aurantiacus]|uniref:hypothetical protein n=1 Tax=Jeotgalibacillus aurantiacus TaxID=2763266 RepID=UPI001D0A02D8|nr:hypothetical protein [Jeotgalibacillus aurantiacus]
MARSLMKTFESIQYESQSDDVFIFKATGTKEKILVYVGKKYGEVSWEHIR